MHKNDEGIPTIFVDCSSIKGCRKPEAKRCSKDDSADAQLRGIQAQLLGAGGTVIANGAPVVFDTVLNDQSPDISYNTFTGQFTISRAGNYYVTWWIDTDGAEAATSVSFGIRVNGGSPVLGSSPIVSGQLNGSALITIAATPSTLVLSNETGASVFIPATAVQANIVIVEVS